MRQYPMFVSLENRSCLVVGAGQVGLRKIETLADCGAMDILVLDKAPPAEALGDLLTRPGLRDRLNFVQREFEDTDLDGMFLVIAATGSADVNRRIAELCRLRGVLCNVVDQPEAGSFIVPSSVRRGDLTLAVSTGGQSPALAKRIRRDLQEAYGPEYGRFLEIMARLRPLVLGLGQETGANTGIFRSLVDSRLLAALKHDDAALARAELAAHIPPQLHDSITEILHGLV